MSLLISLLSGTGSGGGTVTSIATAGLATGGPITDSGTITVTAATQADQETGTSTTTAVTPGRQQFHASSAKYWVKFTTNTTTAITVSYNVTSLTDNGTGDTTITIATDFSSGNFCSVSNSTFNNDLTGIQVYQATLNNASAGSIRVITYNSTTGILDFDYVCVAGFGDQ